MSRTDVHTPAWVKALDPAWRTHFVEVHHHEHGTCTLDQFTAAGRDPHYRGCYLTYRGSRNIYCGCGLCTGHDSRRLAHRQERGQWRQVRRDLLKTVPADRDHMDVPVIRSRAW